MIEEQKDLFKVQDADWLKEQCELRLKSINKRRGEEWEKEIARLQARQASWFSRKILKRPEYPFADREDAIAYLKDDGDSFGSTHQRIWEYRFQWQEERLKQLVKVVDMYNDDKLNAIYLSRNSIRDL